MKCLRHLFLFALLAPALAVLSPLLADEAGGNLIYNQDHRPTDPDYPGSVGIDIVRVRELLFWERAWDERQKTDVVVEQERYTLSSGAHREYIALKLTKLHPRHTLRRDLWALDAGMVSVTVDRGAGLYQSAPGDDRTRFLLPALVGDYTPGPFRLRAGVWKEYDILPMDFQTYSLVLNDNRLLSFGYAPDSRTEGRLSLLNVERRYPSGFSLPRRDVQLELRLMGPVGDEDVPTALRSVEGTLTLKRYPQDGTTQRDLMIKSVMRIRQGRYTHFLVPSLEASTLFTLYRTGVMPDSMRETQQEGLNGSLQLEYTGFTRLEGLPLVLTWGASWREPLLRESRRQRIANLKISWVY